MNLGKDPLKLNAFEFGMDVVFGLITPFLKERNESRLSRVIKRKIALTWAVMCPDDEDRQAVNREERQDRGPTKSAKRKRCKMCIDELAHKEIQNSLASGQNVVSTVRKSHLRKTCFPKMLELRCLDVSYVQIYTGLLHVLICFFYRSYFLLFQKRYGTIYSFETHFFSNF